MSEGKMPLRRSSRQKGATPSTSGSSSTAGQPPPTARHTGLASPSAASTPSLRTGSTTAAVNASGKRSRSPDPRSDGAERAFKRHRGTISAWLPEKGFGFIAVPPSPTGPGRSVFLHWSEFRGPGLPVPGATVSFEMSSNAKGPCARQCVPVGGGGPSSAQQAATQRSSPKAGSSSSPATAAPTAGRATAAAAPPVRKTEFNAQAAYMAQSDMEPGQDDEQYRRARQRNSAFQKRHDVLFTAVIEDGITEEHDADTEASGSSKGKLAEVSENYKQWMQEFQSQQLDRQALGLVSNTNARKGDAAHAAQVVSQHKAALQYLLAQAGPVTLDALKETHRILLSGLSDSAGQFRAGGARAGRTVFMSAPRIPEAMEGFMAGLAHVMGRSDVSGECKAAWALIHLTAIHPFGDGNGRLGRILMNAVLRRSLGLPFVVTLCASESQRKEYTASFRTGADVVRKPVQLTKLIALAVQRLWEEFERFSLRKDKSLAEAANDAIVKKAREEVRSSSCTICFEEAPDTQTLCCGGAFHVKCLIRWLTQGQERGCPCCRAAIDVGAPPAAPAPPPVPDHHHHHHLPGGLLLHDVMMNALLDPLLFGAPPPFVFPPMHPPVPLGHDDETDTTSTTTTDETTEEEEEGDHRPAHAPPPPQPDDDETSETTTTTTEEEEEDGQAAPPPAAVPAPVAPPPSVFCTSCQRNRFASDCAFRCCGRCCSSPFCPRHAR